MWILPYLKEGPNAVTERHVREKGGPFFHDDRMVAKSFRDIPCCSLTKLGSFEGRGATLLPSPFFSIFFHPFFPPLRSFQPRHQRGAPPSILGAIALCWGSGKKSAWGELQRIGFLKIGDVRMAKTSEKKNIGMVRPEGGRSDKDFDGSAPA